MKKRAAGLIVINDGKILMVTRNKNPGKIAIPGGKCEGIEFPVETAIRETYEETGLVCHLLNEDNLHCADDVDGFTFFSWLAKPIGGALRISNEGTPFWLDLEIFKRIPNALAYPDWSRDVIRYFRL
jgi:8-oxo-dGTP pyrophosphatase MutT (NUDIX family)